jgi:hypothetical protein
LTHEAELSFPTQVVQTQLLLAVLPNPKTQLLQMSNYFCNVHILSFFCKISMFNNIGTILEIHSSFNERSKDIRFLASKINSLSTNVI